MDGYNPYSGGSFHNYNDAQERGSFHYYNEAQQRCDDWDDYNSYGSVGYDSFSTYNPNYQNLQNYSWNDNYQSYNDYPPQSIYTTIPQDPDDSTLQNTPISDKLAEAMRELEETMERSRQTRERILQALNGEGEQGNGNEWKDAIVQEDITPTLHPPLYDCPILETEKVKQKACTYKYSCDCGTCDRFKTPVPFPSRLRCVEKKVEKVEPEMKKVEKVECEKVKTIEMECEKARESTPEEDILEIEALLNCDVGTLLEKGDVEVINVKIPTEMSEIILSQADPILVDTPYMINKSGSFDTFSSSFFNFDNEYYCIKFENSYSYNAYYQIFEELEALHGGKSINWLSMAIEKHGTDTFPFDNG